MKAVFDTNILIDFLNGSKKAANEIKLHKHKMISIVTYIELLSWISEGQDEQLIKEFIREFRIINMNINIADNAASIRRDFNMKLPDAVIYASAKEHSARLVTRNTRDFKSSWPDIKIPYTAGTS
jgi:predicted nucleic acid-binding protein